MRDQLSVEDVKMNVDILDVIQEYVILRKSGRNYVGLCPFHSEKTGSFNVNQQEQFFKCFGCGEGGVVFTFLMKITSEPFAVVLKMLRERQENGIKRVTEGSIKKSTKKLPDKELHQISTSLA
nr:CHC2 zinc finger domain-containing protein [Brevibacillus laterosporus]